MMHRPVEIKVQVTGSNPKDYVLEVVCEKGLLTFDFEDRKLSFPSDFKSYCKERGAIWAIVLEDEIKSEIQKYLSA